MGFGFRRKLCRIVLAPFKKIASRLRRIYQGPSRVPQAHRAAVKMACQPLNRNLPVELQEMILSELCGNRPTQEAMTAADDECIRTLYALCLTNMHYYRLCQPYLFCKFSTQRANGEEPDRPFYLFIRTLAECRDLGAFVRIVEIHSTTRVDDHILLSAQARDLGLGDLVPNSWPDGNDSNQRPSGHGIPDLLARYSNEFSATFLFLRMLFHLAPGLETLALFQAIKEHEDRHSALAFDFDEIAARMKQDKYSLPNLRAFRLLPVVRFVNFISENATASERDQLAALELQAMAKTPAPSPVVDASSTDAQPDAQGDDNDDEEMYDEDELFYQNLPPPPTFFTTDTFPLDSTSLPNLTHLELFHTPNVKRPERARIFEGPEARRFSTVKSLCLHGGTLHHGIKRMPLLEEFTYVAASKSPFGQSYASTSALRGEEYSVAGVLNKLLPIADSLKKLTIDVSGGMDRMGFFDILPRAIDRFPACHMGGFTALTELRLSMNCIYPLVLPADDETGLRLNTAGYCIDGELVNEVRVDFAELLPEGLKVFEMTHADEWLWNGGRDHVACSEGMVPSRDLFALAVHKRAGRLADLERVAIVFPRTMKSKLKEVLRLGDVGGGDNLEGNESIPILTGNGSYMRFTPVPMRRLVHAFEQVGVRYEHLFE